MKNSSKFDNQSFREMSDLYESALLGKTDLVSENYKESNGDEMLEEGWWDRAKMRGQQAVGAVQGAVQQGKGKIQQAAGNVVNKAANVAGKAIGVDASQGTMAQKGQQLQQQGQQNIDQGQQQSQQRLVQSAIQISQARTNAVIQDIVNDLNKVGINVQLPQSEVKRIQTVILNAIRRSI